MTSRTDALIERGHAALAACDWGEARACFAQAVEDDPSADALDGLGRALYWLGEYEPAFGYRERAYAAYRRDGDDRAGGAVAVELAALHLWVHGNQAASSGWLAHARRLLERDGDCVERGWLEVLLASTREDPDEQERHARVAVELGRRFQDPGLEYDAIAHVGMSLVRRGEIAEGMSLIDEAVAAVSSGIVADPWPAGEIYCSLFGACEVAIDVRRAEGWLSAIDGYVERTGELPVSAICRMHYGGVLTSAGRWTDAELELTAAIDLYDRTWRGSRFEPAIRLADLRVRQGRLQECRQLLEGHEEAPEAASPLARLHLAAGEPALAETTIERCLTRRGRGLASAPLLGLLVEAKLAGQRSDEAAEVARELDLLARATGQPAVDGLAALAQARIAATRSTLEAVELLERALAAFDEAELPYELARTRLVLAEQLADERPEIAGAEARAALTCFEQLPAAPEAQAAAGLLRELGGSTALPTTGPGALTPRESEVLALLAEGRSNADIAGRLHISVRTAEDHVSKILSKLGLRNRTEAAAYRLHTDGRTRA